MPFYLRTVPALGLGKRLSVVDSHGASDDAGDDDARLGGDELCATANVALTATLRQLSGLALAAEQLFQELQLSFDAVSERAAKLQTRVDEVRLRVVAMKDEDIVVPESDLCTVSQRRHHFSSDSDHERSLFTAATRPEVIQSLYQRAVLSPVAVLRQLDAFRNDGLRSSKFFCCTPTQQSAGKSPALDIETRKPEAVRDLPEWTVDEEVLTSPVHPDLRFHTTLIRATSEGALHQLPSPEEVIKARSDVFAAELVAVDVTGRGFQRQLQFRRSLVHYDYAKLRRRKRTRRRRNTICDSGDARSALQYYRAHSVATISRPVRTDTRETQTDALPSDGAESHYFSSRELMADIQRRMASDTSAPLGRRRNLPDSSQQPEYAAAGPAREPSLAVRRRTAASCSEGSSSGHGSGGSNRTSADSERVASPADSGTVTSPLEETAALQLTSSAGVRPLAASPADSGLSDGRLDAVSFTSEETVTPELAVDDGDTSSAFSCDTEGYYTSFHCDSGVRAVYGKATPVPRLALSDAGSSCSSERGSTGVRRRPRPPLRASSLDAANRESIVTVIHVPRDTDSPAASSSRDSASRQSSPVSDAACWDSEPDSGTGADSASASAVRLRAHLRLSAGGIPALCVVTPPASEDGDSAGHPGQTGPLPRLAGPDWQSPGRLTRRSDDSATYVRTDSQEQRGYAGELREQEVGTATLETETGAASRGGEYSREKEETQNQLVHQHVPKTVASDQPSSPLHQRGAEAPGSCNLEEDSRWAKMSSPVYRSDCVSPSSSPANTNYAGISARRSYQALPPVENRGASAMSPHHFSSESSSASPAHSPYINRNGHRTLFAPSPEAAQRVHPGLQNVTNTATLPSRVSLKERPAAGAPGGFVEGSPASARAASVTGESPMTSPSPVTSPALPRAGSLDRRSIRRYTDRIYSSLRQLRGRRFSLAEAKQGLTGKPPIPNHNGSPARPGENVDISKPRSEGSENLCDPRLFSSDSAVDQRRWNSQQQLQAAEWCQRQQQDRHSVDGPSQRVCQRLYGDADRLGQQPRSPLLHERHMADSVPNFRQSNSVMYGTADQNTAQQQHQRSEPGLHHARSLDLIGAQERREAPRLPSRPPPGTLPSTLASRSEWPGQGAVYQAPGDLRMGPAADPRPGWPRQLPYSPRPARQEGGSGREDVNAPSRAPGTPHHQPGQTSEKQHSLSRHLPMFFRLRSSRQEVTGSVSTPERHRKPTPAAGAIAVPPGGQLANSHAPSSAAPAQTYGSAEAVPDGAKSPRFRHPFSFGRHSLRGPRGSAGEEVAREVSGQAAASVTQPSSETARPPARAEKLETPRTDEQKLKRLKKRWFFTLPGKQRRSKLRAKPDESSDDDGGFGGGVPRPAVGGVARDGGFVRYESPDSISSAVSSRSTTPLTDNSLSSSYFEMEQYFPGSLSGSQSSGRPPSTLSAESERSARNGEAARRQLTAPRAPNFSNPEYSPPGADGSGAGASTAAGLISPGGAPPQGVRYPPQQSGPLQDASAQPIYGSPTVFQRSRWHPQFTGQAAAGGRWPAYPVSRTLGSPQQFPPTLNSHPGTASGSRPGVPPDLSVGGQRSSWAGGAASPVTLAGQRGSWAGAAAAPHSPSKPGQLTRPTPLTEFKQLVARQRSPSLGGSPARQSAADRLRTSSPGPPPRAPPPQSPVDARNSARAVLFETRFGSNRRGRNLHTSVIATTIPETEEDTEQGLPPARRRLFNPSDETSSSGDSPSRQILRMSPSSPPPPYSSRATGTPPRNGPGMEPQLLTTRIAPEHHFTPVLSQALGGFKRSFSLPRNSGSRVELPVTAMSDDERPPIGSISRYQYRNRPCAALATQGAAVNGPFQRSRSARFSRDQQPVNSPPMLNSRGDRPRISPREETAI